MNSDKEKKEEKIREKRKPRTAQIERKTNQGGSNISLRNVKGPYQQLIHGGKLVEDARTRTTVPKHAKMNTERQPFPIRGKNLVPLTFIKIKYRPYLFIVTIFIPH